MVFTLHVLIQVWLPTNPDHTQAAFLFCQEGQTWNKSQCPHLKECLIYCPVVAVHVTPLFPLMYLCSQGLLDWRRAVASDSLLYLLGSIQQTIKGELPSIFFFFAHQSQLTCQVEYHKTVVEWLLVLCIFVRSNQTTPYHVIRVWLIPRSNNQDISTFAALVFFYCSHLISSAT